MPGTLRRDPTEFRTLMIRRALLSTREILEMVKFEHSVFALPFAFIGMLLAADGFPDPSVVFWLVVAMLSVRSAAMAFNRIVDLRWDALNPRTADRALPSGRIGLWQAWIFFVVMSAIFFASAAALNPLALALSPLALVLVTTYSYSKRITWLTHLWLGVAIGAAPTAAWIGVTGWWSPIPLWFSGAVALWVAGFDILYSLADEKFDREHGLHSIPARFGTARALIVSRCLHLFSTLLLLAAGVAAGLGSIYYLGVCVVALTLIYEHSLVRDDDLSRLNTAFFTANGFVSIALLTFVLADRWVRL